MIIRLLRDSDIEIATNDSKGVIDNSKIVLNKYPISFVTFLL